MTTANSWPGKAPPFLSRLDDLPDDLRGDLPDDLPGRLLPVLLPLRVLTGVGVNGARRRRARGSSFGQAHRDGFLWAHVTKPEMAPCLPGKVAGDCLPAWR